jgi:hypothetical protein
VASTGFNFPASSANYARQVRPDWGSISNIYTTNGSWAYVNLDAAEGSDYLGAYNFTMGVPTDIVITGITVRIHGFAPNSSIALWVQGDVPNSTGTIDGDLNIGTLPTTNGDLEYTLPDVSTATPSIVNATSFGVRLYATNNDSTTRQTAIDSISIEISWGTGSRVQFIGL